MLIHLPAAWQVALAVVGQLGLTLVLGGVLLRMAGLWAVLAREAWPVRGFACLLVGGLALPAAYAVVLLNGQTVAVLVLVALVGLFGLARKLPAAGPAPDVPPSSWLTGLLLVGCGLAVAAWYPIQCVHGGEYPWQIIRSDHGYYAQIARFLAAGFPENDRIHENLLSADRLPPMPYHYFELWNSCWIARWTGLPHLAALQPVHAAQFLVICWLGLLALAARWGRLGPLQVVGATLLLLFKPDYLIYLFNFLIKLFLLFLSEKEKIEIISNPNESLLIQDLSFIGLYSELANIQVKTLHVNALLIGAALLWVRGQRIGAAAGLVLLPLLAVGSAGLMLAVGAYLVYRSFARGVDRAAARRALAAALVLAMSFGCFYFFGLTSGAVHALAVGGSPVGLSQVSLMLPHPPWAAGLARLLLILLLLWGLLVGLAGCHLSSTARAVAGAAAALLASGLLAWLVLDPVLVVDANQFFLVALPVLPLVVAAGLFAGLAQGRRPVGLVLVVLAAGSLWQVRLAWTRATVWYGPDRAFLAAAARQPVQQAVGGYLPNLANWEARTIFERMIRIQGLNELYTLPPYAGNEALVNCDSLPQAHTEVGRWLSAQSFFTRWAREEQAHSGPIPLPQQQQRFVERYEIDWLLLAPGVALPAWVGGRVRFRLQDPATGHVLVGLKPAHGP